jgi:hypothetical protein
MKRFLLFIGVFSVLTFRLSAQIVLTNSPYQENFNSLGSGLPTGFSVYFGASSSSIGTAATYSSAHTARNNTTARFNNYASLNSGTDASTNTDRALGVRQTSSTGDPGASFVAQLANTTNKSNLKLSFKLQSLDAASPRVATWVVQYAIGDATPTSFTAIATSPASISTGGSQTSNTTVNVDFGTALDNISSKVWIRIVTLASTSGTGNRPSSAIDDFSLTFDASGAPSPMISASPTSVTFANQNINTTATEKTLELTYSNLTTDDLVLTTAAPFSISKTNNGTYGSSLTYTNAELSSPTTLYVRYAPTVAGASTGNITISGGGLASNANVALSGTGIDPNATSFNFESCSTNGSSSLSDGFYQYSVIGAQTWGCGTTFGHNNGDATGASNAGNGLQINGFSGGNIQNEDWLISPSFNISSYNYPLLSFWSRNKFTGAQLKLMVTTNYSGTGDPYAAGVTWTEVDGKFPAGNTDVWTKSENIDLSAFKTSGSSMYIAFVYTSTTVDGARWSLDDFTLTNSATPAPAEIATNPSSLEFGYQANGTTSTSKTVAIAFSNLTNDASLNVTGNFSISLDNNTFGQNLTITSPGTANQTVYVKFSPTAADSNFQGTLTIASNGATTKTVALSGSTLSFDNTLEVVNWNIEWFGHTGNGPTDEAKQKANVIKVMKSINADIYCLGEIVNTTALADVAQQIGVDANEYGYFVSTYGSYAQNTSDPDYANAQKLAFVYRKSIISPIGTPAGLLYTTNESDAVFNYWASGRFPYEMKANVTLNGITKQVNFIMIHAKAETSSGSYTRRKNAAIALKSYLDTNEDTDNFIILGDYNDDLDATISTASEAGADYPKSSYQVWLDDNAKYSSPTLPLSQSGKKSTVSYNDVIDHVTLSNEMKENYVNGSAQILTSVTGVVSPDNYGSTTSDHYPVFTRYSFTNNTLPVKFDEFTAKQEGNNVVLKWATQTETNNQYFTIERSYDGKSFEKIKVVEGKINANQKNNYSIVDNNVKAGTSYYRLKQTDIDGKSSYFPELRLVNVLKNESGVIYPNPIKSNVFINYNSNSANLNLNVVGIDGKLLVRLKGSVKSMEQELNNRLQLLKPGSYFIQLIDKGIVTATEKLIKE